MRFCIHRPGVALALAALTAVCVPAARAPRFALRTEFGAVAQALPPGVGPVGRSSLPNLTLRVQRQVGPETPASRRCREILVRNEAVLAQAGAASGLCAATAIETVRGVFSQCAATAGGGWATQLRALQIAARPTGCVAAGQWRLVAIDAAGALAEERDLSSGQSVPALRTLEFEFEGQAMIRSSEAVLISSDLDGDARPEVVVVAYARRMEGDLERSEREIEVRTALDDRVLRYGPTSALPIEDVQDVDEDGRVDFVLSGPYAWTVPIACGQGIERGVMTLLGHTLPDGSVSTDDEVAQGWARRWCPDRGGEPSPNAALTDLDREGLRVVCRRLWGESPHRTLESVGCRHFRVVSEWPCEPGARPPLPLRPRECPAHFRQWALTPAPLRLR